LKESAFAFTRLSVISRAASFMEIFPQNPPRSEDVTR